MNIPEELRVTAGNIKLLLMDCDGVLTDGSLYFTAQGESMKIFNVRDGQGIVMWHTAGGRSGVISGRDARAIVEARARELGMQYVRTASVNKAEDLASILADAGVSAEQTAFVGDDIGDLPVMALVGLPIAVADAIEPVKAAARFVTSYQGGRGAIREVTDLLIAAQRSGD
jgi:3-deoxy-D-manno-octulosonate 8-phosphate phosphatase (KDO 8-P phosphatase)